MSCRHAFEDHLRAALIWHGDSVIVIMRGFINKQGGTAEIFVPCSAVCAAGDFLC